MVYAGTLQCYGQGAEVVGKLMGLKVSQTQLYRLTDFYGQQVGERVDFTARTATPLKDDEVLYVEADGSMVLTREGYKEVKVGRVFKSSDCLHPQGKEGIITHSQYLCRRGNCKAFKEDMEKLVENYTTRQRQLVFITDGAPWLRNWIEDAYPQALSVLDFYHLSEHFYGFAELFFSDKQERDEWVTTQKQLSLESNMAVVIKNIEGLTAIRGKKKEVKEALLSYLRANEGRVDYKRYRQIGCAIIGSGAIESAHRTVVQKRMKLSGQRWSGKGADNMLNLRTIYMNRQWDKVINIIKQDHKKAA